MNNNWNAFQVFDGPCVLDHTIFNAVGLVNTRRGSAGRFFTWVNNLHQALAQGGACGIPPGRVQDVTNLLNAFFPVVQFDNNNQGRPSFPDVRYIQQNNAVAVTANPVHVTFGSGQLAINDGPSALGYIFSIAQAPAAGPPFANTWDDYVLPLLALYSRCLYLAYIGCMIPNPNNANNANLLWWESNQNVPWMSGAMYFTDHTNVLRVLLSSTYLPGRENWAPAAATTRAKMEMMNQWRKAHVLNPALQFYQPHRVMPPPQHPVAPIVKESLGEGIYRILLSLDLNLAGAALTQLPNHIPALPVNNTWQTVPAGLVDTIWESARAILAAAWIQANPTQPIAALPRDRVWDTAPLGDQLRIALRPVVNVRFAPGYNPINHAANIDNAFRPVFDLLFCPRMFHALPPNPTDPLAPLAPNLIQGEQTSLILGVQAQKDSIWETLYIPHRTAILEMLDRYHHWVTNDDAALAVPSQSLQRYGRCCETYSIAALLPNYTPNRKLPAAADNPQPPNNHPVSTVRGFAFQTRQFSDEATSGAPFLGGGNNFTAARLVQWHTNLGRKGIFRRPCRNCKALLPFFDVPLDNALTHVYYDHLNQLVPNAQTSVPDDPLV